MPQIGLGFGKLTAFNIGNGAAEGKGIEFIVDDGGCAPLGGTVVVVGGKSLQIRLDGAVLYPPVEIDNARLEAIDDLTAAQQPVGQEFIGRRWNAENIRAT